MRILTISKGDLDATLSGDETTAAEAYAAAVEAAAALDSPVPVAGLFSAVEIEWATRRAPDSELFAKIDARLDEVGWDGAVDQVLAQGPARLVLAVLEQAGRRGQVEIVTSTSAIASPIAVA